MDKDDGTGSINPLRRWFHRKRYDITNTLVKEVYRKGMVIGDMGSSSCSWNVDGLPVFGLDRSRIHLEDGVAKGRLKDYKVVELDKTGIDDSSFDIITVFETLEHILDYDAVLREIRRIMKDSGYLIVSVPYDVPFSFWRLLFSLQVFIRGFLMRDPYYLSRCGHVNHFSVEGIKSALARNGFTSEKVFVMNGFTIFGLFRFSSKKKSLKKEVSA